MTLTYNPADQPLTAGTPTRDTTGRRRILRLARHWPWTGHITAALDRLTQLPDPG